MMNDAEFMRQALLLGHSNLGQTFPNPSVGCVIVKNGIVIGKGFTSKGGRPHAEVNALREAGDNAKGATAYVTLEPCAHIGHTSPCCEALVKAGISRVVIGTVDPDERVAGKGIDYLKSNGLEVVTGVCEVEANKLHRGHITRVTKNRPFITLKVALSKDGFLAPLGGVRRQISGEKARDFVHTMRSENDAIMIGHNTALIDDPALTCRINGLEHRTPLRVVLGNSEWLMNDSVLSKNTDTPLFVFDKTLEAPLVKGNITLFPLTSLENAMQQLAEQGITLVMVEGGKKLSESLLKAGLVDELVIIHSKTVMLGEGLALDLDKKLPNETYDLGDDEVTFTSTINSPTLKRL